MADVKERYLTALRNAKDRVQQAKASTDRTQEEERIFQAFRKHAKLDYQTLRKPKPTQGRA